MCLAAVAGLVSFTSPCTLPLLPGYVSYVSGMTGPVDGPDVTGTARRRALGGATLFVLGFSVVFTALGATASALGFLLVRHQRLLDLGSGILVFVMGLATIGVIRVPLLQRQVRFDLRRIGTGPSRALPLGAAFAFGWTPCVGPVLASILATAASTTTAARGAILLFTFSLGLGTPFLFLAIGMVRGRARIDWLRRNGRRLEIGGGLLLAAMGIALATGMWTTMMSWALTGYASFGWPPI